MALSWRTIGRKTVSTIKDGIDMSQGSLVNQFKTADILTKVIVINALIFIVVTIAAALLQISAGVLLQWFVLPEDVGRFIIQPWSLITYGFLHAGFFHILFNTL